MLEIKEIYSILSQYRKYRFIIFIDFVVFLNFIHYFIIFYCLLRIIIYILPTLVLLFFTKPERNFNLLVFIFFVYFISLFLGTHITNIYPYIILLPIMLLINSYAFKNIKGGR